MSASYHAIVQALATDPELAEAVKAASTAEERAGVLVAAGFELPTQAEIDAAQLADVSGGQQATTVDCAVVGGSYAAVTAG